MKHVLEFLCAEQIPLALSVPMLLASKGLSVADIAMSAGCHRAHIHACLRGRYSPNQILRAAMQEVLGCDPWIVAGA